MTLKERTHHRAQSALRWPQRRAAQTVDDMGGLVIDWLAGDTPTLPWEMGGPYEETAPLYMPLMALNRLSGVCTTTSQPGVIGHWGRQRAYVDGLATPEAGTMLRRRAVDAGLIYREQNPDHRPRPAELLACPSVSQAARRAELRTVTRGVIPGYLALHLPRSLVLRLRQRGTVAFAVHDPQWSREDHLWSALLGTHHAAPCGPAPATEFDTTRRTRHGRP